MALFNVTVRAQLSETTVDELTSRASTSSRAPSTKKARTAAATTCGCRPTTATTRSNGARKKVEDAGGDATRVECGGPVYT